MPVYEGERLTRAEFSRRATRRKPGNCQDCGNFLPVRQITFWATGMPYVVCAECERAYRNVINWPVVEIVPHA